MLYLFECYRSDVHADNRPFPNAQVLGDGFWDSVERNESRYVLRVVNFMSSRLTSQAWLAISSVRHRCYNTY